MLSLVNTQKVEKIISSYVGESVNVEPLLKSWAFAKQDIFKLFGQSLTIERPFKESLPDEDIEVLWYQFLDNMHTTSQDFNNSMGLHNQFYRSITAEELRTNTCIEQREYMLEHKYKIGMKISKFMRNLIVDTPNANIIKDKLKSSREYFDIKLSMLNQSLNFDGIMIISIDPCDILTMSINKYDWDSCHDLDDGCHKAGSLSYIQDEHSAVAFVLKDKTEYSYNRDTYTHTSKKWRQMVYINLDTMVSLHCRQYTADNENAAKVSRQLMADTFAKHFNISNDYKVSRDLDLARELVENCEEIEDKRDHYTHLIYNDVLLTTHEISIVTMKDATTDRNESIMTIGDNEVLCPVCSNHYLTKSDELKCEYCLGDLSECECNDCGRELDEDTCYTDNNGTEYCHSCYRNHYSYCEDCGEDESNEEGEYVESVGRWVCNSCLRRNYIQCEECGEYYEDDNIQQGHCPDCHEELFTMCSNENCEEYHLTSNMEEHENKMYCVSCYDDLMEDLEEEEELDELVNA